MPRTIEVIFLLLSIASLAGIYSFVPENNPWSLLFFNCGVICILFLLLKDFIFRKKGTTKTCPKKYQSIIIICGTILLSGVIYLVIFSDYSKEIKIGIGISFIVIISIILLILTIKMSKHQSHIK